MGNVGLLPKYLINFLKNTNTTKIIEKLSTIQQIILKNLYELWKLKEMNN